MANYTVNNLNEAAWLVYINGLELPVSRVEVQWTIWQMPILTLQMVPHPILTRIGAEDRLQVLVCYLDVHWNPDDPQFCVLGEYEVMGWAYNNTPRGRFIQLNCVSQLQILDQLHFYYMSGVEDVPAGLLNANEAVTQPKVFYPASLFYEGLVQPPPEAADTATATNADAKTQFIRRPIDFVLNVFRALRRPVDMEAKTYAEVKPGYVAKDASGNPGKNFFSRWMTLTKFHERWAALPLMEDTAVVGEREGCFPIIQATQETMILGLLERTIGEGVGAVGTAWELLRQILGYMCMEICAIPAPPYSYTTGRTGELTSNILDEVADSTNGFYSIPTYFVKPQCIFALPPICNVIFPSMTTNFGFAESYITQPTRIYLGETFLSTQLNQNQNAALQTITNQLMQTGYPVGVKERIKTLGVDGNLNSKNFLLFPEEFFKGPVTRQLSAPPWMYLMQQSFTTRTEEGVDQVKQADSSAREAALNEAKRTNVSRNALLNNDLISEEGKAKELQKIDQKIQQEVEMKFAAAGTAQATAAAVEALVPAAAGEASVLGNIFDVYAQYEYYRSRFAERNGTCNLAWNPYIVPGFPTVIFDDLSAGIDMFGYVTSVSHVMSAERGGSTMSTSVSLSFMRTVEEYIGIFDKSASERYAQGYSTFPPEVIPDVQEYFQKVSNAKTIYERLFFGGLKVENKSAVFDWRSIVEATSDYVEIDLASPHFNEYSFIQFTPKEEYMPLYKNRDAALGFVARPVCTLQQYIECWHKARISALKANNTIKGEEYSFHSPVADSVKRGGTIFWSRIYTLKPGPGKTPDALVMNMTSDYMVPPNGEWTGVGPETGFPETRVDWDKKLEEYRKIIRSTDSNVVPQK